jgi:threonine aldolase
MAAAEVGDDQYGEDPTVNRLQEHVAGLLGKDAALWLPSGTMANQIGLRLLTRPGDDVIVSRESHTVWHETAANAGVQFTEIGARGLFTAEEVLAARKPRGHIVYPPTTLIVIENTHNRAGGVVFPLALVERIAAAAREHQLAMFLDGARLWNAAIVAGQTPAALAAPFDLVTVAFSKGLGAPAGSMLAGSKDLIAAAVRYRRMYGGAMRQVGILAAAALYALDRNLERLVEDHVNARRMAVHLAEVKPITIDPDQVETNIVIFHLAPSAPDAATVVARAAERGVLVFAFGPRTVRAVTHLDVSRAHCDRAAAVLAEVAAGRGLV